MLEKKAGISMYVKSLSVKNLRCFVEAEVKFWYPGRAEDGPELPNINLLLGDNGAGKTTLLRAVALAVLSEIIPSSGYVPYNLLRQDLAKPRGGGASFRAEVRACLALDAADWGQRSGSLPDSIEVGSTIERIRSGELISPLPLAEGEAGSLREVLYDDLSPAFLLVGYGATRWIVGVSEFEPLANQRRRRRPRYQRVAGLFEEHLGLTPLAAWYPRQSESRKAEIGEILGDLLPDGSSFLGRRVETDEEDYLFSHRGVGVPLGAMSDGYRAYIGWVTDLLSHIATGTPSTARLRDAHGVVLIDEIDLHLHPEWQRQVVPVLARVFPRLQFILTTHSPIVAGTLSRQNIFVLDGEQVAQLPEPIHGLNADQILIGPYFNLETTRAPGAIEELQRLSKRAMHGDHDAALTYLEKLAVGFDEPET
ncbi:MAG TPA: AAA family ATPase [Thermoanaerobaculia bacterium]|nr:AAA family ATPase [Thermoanaerobaculia bacterium]